jgi:hypothetical protein
VIRAHVDQGFAIDLAVNTDSFNIHQDRAGDMSVNKSTGFPLQWLVATSGESLQKCSEAGRRVPSDHTDVPNGAFCRLGATFAGFHPR